MTFIQISIALFVTFVPNYKVDYPRFTLSDSQHVLTISTPPTTTPTLILTPPVARSQPLPVSPSPIALVSSNYTPGTLPEPWKCIAWYESTDRNVSNGLGDYGYFQISESSWLAAGMIGNPMDYGLDTQLLGARRVERMQGFQAWETHSLCGV